MTFAKALKFERNQALAKDSGVISTLSSQVASNDYSVASSAAIAITALSKNGMGLSKIFITDLLTNRVQFAGVGQTWSRRISPQTHPN